MTDRQHRKLMADLLPDEAFEKLLAKTHLARARIWIRLDRKARIALHLASLETPNA